VIVTDYFRFIFVDRFGPVSDMFGSMPTLDYVLNISVYSIITLALSLAVAIGLGVFLGTLVSSKQGGKFDAFVTIAVLVPFSFPVWWVALALRSYLYPPFPAFNWYSNRWIWESPWSDVSGFTLDFLSHAFLPILCFVASLMGIYLLVARNSLREVYTENYITTAKAKGLSPLRIMFKHALRNAMIPVVSAVALTPPLLMLATILTERVFSRSGLGEMLLRTSMDPSLSRAVAPSPLLQAVFIVLSTVVIVVHFLVDISASFLDPRIRTDGAGLPIRGDETGRLRMSLPLRKRFLEFLRGFMKGYSGKFGLGVILFFALAGLLVPYLPIPDPSKIGVTMPDPFQPPNLNHLLGTDEYGRDMLAMILWGARSSVIEGLGAVALALVIGYFVGLFAGYLNDHWIGYLLDRATDLFLSIPIIVVAVYFPNILSTETSALKWLFAVGLTTWPFTAKLVRAAVISAKDKPFVEASRAAGAGRIHIMFRVLLPDCLPAAASSLPLLAVTALSIQSSLDYLGFQRNLWSRVDPVLLAPYSSWGTILSYGAQSFFAKKWWVMFPPAICIALFGLALIAIGNKTMEVVNPRLSRTLIPEL